MRQGGVFPGERVSTTHHGYVGIDALKSFTGLAFTDGKSHRCKDVEDWHYEGRVVTLKYSGGKVTMAADQDVKVAGGWKKAGRMHVGDFVVTERGDWVAIENVDSFTHSGTVYGVEVDKADGYIVNGIVVRDLS